MATKHAHGDVRAIVVDDNKDVLAVFTELLQIHGVDVVAKGANGKEAAELYQEYRPDIVFMDANMEKYDGFWGIEKIREQDQDATVVLVTGSIDVEDRVRCCSASAIIGKPIDMNKVMEIVNGMRVPSRQFLKISQ